MKHIMWGAYGACLALIIWTLCQVTGTTMPNGLATMRPMGLVGAGFFWGVVLCMIRDKLGPKHAQ